MKYWIITDGVQKGPLSIEELSAIPGLTMSTPVWHEGLPDWTSASAVPEIAAMLAGRTPQQTGDGQPYGYQQPYGQPRYGYQPYNQQTYGYGQPQFVRDPMDPNRMPPMPNTYLVWAILATICCCLPTGVVAIIFASKVSPSYMRGDYNAALDASSKAQLWVIISFVTGLIWAPFSVLFSLL